MEVVDTGNAHVFAYRRHSAGGSALVFANFSEAAQPIASDVLREAALGNTFKDLVSGEDVQVGESLVLKPYGFVWLAASG